MATPTQRTHLKSLMDFLMTHKSQVHYNQLRPMALFSPWISEQDVATQLNKGGYIAPYIAPDCSEMITWLCRAAGMRDPSGPSYAFDGYGNTQTMFDYLAHPSGSALIPHTGALVVFGADYAPPPMATAPDAKAPDDWTQDVLEYTGVDIRGNPVPRWARENTAEQLPQPLSNQHVTMVYEPSTTGNIDDTVMFSHGSSAGPLLITLRQYKAAVPSEIPITFLSTAAL